MTASSGTAPASLRLDTAPLPTHFEAIPGVADVCHWGAPDRPIDLLIEVPHGATSRADFDAIARQLVSALPEQLEHFFFVNTDVGAYELGLAVAYAVATARPGENIRISNRFRPSPRGAQMG